MCTGRCPRMRAYAGARRQRPSQQAVKAARRRAVRAFDASSSRTVVAIPSERAVVLHLLDQVVRGRVQRMLSPREAPQSSVGPPLSCEVSAGRVTAARRVTLLIQEKKSRRSDATPPTAPGLAAQPHSTIGVTFRGRSALSVWLAWTPSF